MQWDHAEEVLGWYHSKCNCVFYSKNEKEKEQNLEAPAYFQHEEYEVFTLNLHKK